MLGGLNHEYDRSQHCIQNPATTYELAAMLIKSAFHVPGGLKPSVRFHLQNAHQALLEKNRS
jgi:hypothetical protein